MAGDSLREARFGVPATPGTAPATWYKIPVEEYDHDTSPRGREEVNLLRNTANRASHINRKGESDIFKIHTHAVFTWLVYFWTCLFGLPTTSNHAGATGVKDHAFVDNDSDQPLWFRFLNSLGWWEAPDYVADQVAVKQDNETRELNDWTFHGPKAYPISVQRITFGGGPAGGSTILTVPAIAGRTPAIPAQPTAAVVFNETAAALKTKLEALSRIGAGGVDVTRTGSGTAIDPYVYTVLIRERYTPIALMTYVDSWTGGTTPATVTAVRSFDTDFPLSESWSNYEPSCWAQFLGKIDGVAAHIKSYAFTVARGRKPNYSGDRSTNPAYYDKPDIKITGSFLPDYKLSGDLGSAFERFRNGDIAPKLEFDYISNDSIGTGTPTTPCRRYTLYKATSKTAKQDLKGTPTTTPITFVADYSSSDGGSLATLLTNEIASVATS